MERGKWRTVFGARNRQVGHVELGADGRWYATAGRLQLGSFGSAEAAEAFARAAAGEAPLVSGTIAISGTVGISGTVSLAGTT